MGRAGDAGESIALHMEWVEWVEGVSVHVQAYSILSCYQVDSVFHGRGGLGGVHRVHFTA